MIGRTDNIKTMRKWIAAEVSSRSSLCSVRVLNWIADNTNMNMEERCWISWLFGCFYTTSTCLFVFKNFKDPGKFDLAEFSEWHDEFGEKLFYQNDRIYIRGELPEMVDSYKKVLNGRSQEEFYSQFNHLPPVEAFDNVFEEVKKIFNFGRFSSFFMTECLFHVANGKIKIRCEDPKLRKSKTVAKALLYALKQHDKNQGLQIKFWRI